MSDVGAAAVVRVLTGGGADAELAADALWAAGASAIEEREAGGGAVLLAGPAGDADPAPLLAAVSGRWPAELLAVDLDAALDGWRPHARAVIVGDLVVRPPWVAGPGKGAGAAGGPPVRRGLAEVVIDPGRAFGSGSHASTRLALRALAALVRGGELVLDVGCGSGVLAIAALVLGAERAIAVDVDPEAAVATRANAERNAVADRLTVAERLPPAPGGADVIVANMTAATLVELAPAIRSRLRPGGAQVLSGLLADQRDPVLAAFGQPVPAAEWAEDGWLALTLRAAAA